MEKCKSTIAFGDDYGDNSTTFHCQKKEGHTGEHKEEGNMYGQPYVLKWRKKYKCFLCPKKFQSENDLKRHAERIHGIKLCEECLMQEATERCEKGMHLCYGCAGIHIRDGHKLVLN